MCIYNICKVKNETWVSLSDLEKGKKAYKVTKQSSDKSGSKKNPFDIQQKSEKKIITIHDSPLWARLTWEAYKGKMNTGRLQLTKTIETLFVTIL